MNSSFRKVSSHESVWTGLYSLNLAISKILKISLYSGEFDMTKASCCKEQS